jgi:WD40 repeat protein
LLASAASALFLSLVTVCLLAGVVLSLGLLYEKESLWERDYVSIRHAVVSESGDLAASVFWWQPARGKIQPTQLGMQDLSESGSPVQIPWPALQPACLVSPPASDLLIVGAADGGLYRINLSVSGSAGGAWWAEPTLQGQGQPAPEPIGQQADGEVLCLECTTDERLLVSAGHANLYGWDLESRALLWRRDALEANCIALDPRSRRLICGLRDGQIVELDSASGRTLRLLARMAYPVCQVAISPDGQSVVGIGAEGRILTLEASSGECRWQDAGSPCHAGGFRVASFSPCGKMLVTVAKEDIRKLAIWSASTGQWLGYLQGHSRAVAGASFASDGKLYSWGTDGTIRAWNVQQQAPLSVSSLLVPAQTG